MALVRGRVESIGRSLRAGWINLEGGVSLRIDNRDPPPARQAGFQPPQGTSLRGARLDQPAERSAQGLRT
jgi:hypothetical protein